MTCTKDQEQEICRACGFCCDGTLFTRTSILKNEYFPDTNQDENNNYWLKQPCSYYDQSCTIYDQQRPKDCSDFKCELLKKFSNGKLEFHELVKLIKRIKEQRGRLYKLIPNASTNDRLQNAFETFLHHHKSQLESTVFKMKYRELLLEWASYKTRLVQFRYQDKKP